MLKLKKTEHLYYCEKYNTDNFQEYSNWEEFKEAYKLPNADHDLNYLVRYDLDKDPTLSWRLNLFYIQQRKGRYVPVVILNIKEENLEEINNYLKSCWKYTMMLWEEISMNKEGKNNE